MLFALICTDKQPDGLEIRKANREAHLQFLDQLGGQMKAAGPFLDDAGEKPIGSLVVIEAASLEEAEKIASEDPYAKAGVFEKVEIRVWNWLLKNPEIG